MPVTNSTIGKYRKELRSTYLRKIMALTTPAKTITQIRTDYKGFSIFQLSALVHILGETYLSVDPIKSDPNYIAGDPATYKNYYHTRNLRFEKVYAHILVHPFVPEVVDFIKNIKDIIDDGNSNSSSAEDIILTLKQAQDSYAEKVAQRIHSFKKTSISAIDGSLNDPMITITENNWTQIRSEANAGSKAYHKELMKLINVLVDQKTDETVYRYVFNQGPGSSGYATTQTVHFPVMLPIFPVALQSEIFDMYDHGRRQHTPAPSDEDIDDDAQEKLEKEYLISEKRRLDSDDGARHSGTATPNWQSFFPPGFGQPSAGGGTGPDPNSGAGNANAGGSGPQPQGQQPAIPDDDNYEPDSALASRAADMTREYRTTVPTDMSHDHMTRFSTNSEASTTVSRANVRQTDWTFITKTRYATTRYLVTFTRKSKKPIFSIVPM